MACFERNLHAQISCGDSVLSTTFCGDHIVNTIFSMTHYDITIGNEIARGVTKRRTGMENGMEKWNGKVVSHPYKYNDIFLFFP